MTEKPNPDASDSNSPEQPKRPKFIFPGAEENSPSPATPIIPSSDEEQPASPVAEPDPTRTTPAEPVAAETPAAPDPAPAPPVAPEQPPAPEPAPAPPAEPETAKPLTAAPAPANETAAQPVATPAPGAKAGQLSFGSASTGPASASVAVATPAEPSATPAAPIAEGLAGPATLISGSTETSQGGVSNAVKFTIMTVLLVAIIFTGIFVIGKAANNKQTETLNALLAQVEDASAKDLPTTEEEAYILLNAARSLKTTSKREAIYKRLLVGQGSGINLDELIASFAASEENEMTPDIRIKFFDVVYGRNSSDSLSHLIGHARNSSRPETAEAALKSAKKLATDDDVPALLTIIQFTTHSNVRQEAKLVVSSLASRSSARPKLAGEIKAAHDSATSDDARLIFIELLGAAGGKEATIVVEKALASESQMDRLSAIAALGIWADDTQFEMLLDHLGEEEDERLRRRAFDSAYQFLMIQRKRDPSDLERMWKDLASEAQSPADKMKIVNGIARVVEDWSFTIVEFFIEDENDDVSWRAEKAMEKMEERRSRLKPSVSDEDDEEDEGEEK